MIAFAFGEPKDPLDSSETAEMLMMKLLMIAIENERLSAENYCRSITQDSALSKYGREKEAGYQTFRVSDKQNKNCVSDKEKSFSKQLQLWNKKVQCLTATISQMQMAHTRELQTRDETLRKMQQIQTNSRREISQTRSQLTYYRTRNDIVLENQHILLKVQEREKFLEGELTQRTQQVVNLTAQLQLQHNKADQAFKAMQESLKKQLQILQRQLTRAKEAFSSKQAQNGKLIAILKDYEAQYNLYCGNMQQQQQKCCQLQTQLQNVRDTENLKKQKELFSVKETHQSRILSYEKVIAELERRNTQTAQRTRKLEEERDSAIQQWNNLSKQMGKQKGLLQSMQSEVDQCYQQMKTNLQQQTCLQKAYLSDKEGQMIFQRPTMLESVQDTAKAMLEQNPKDLVTKMQKNMSSNIQQNQTDWRSNSDRHFEGYLSNQSGRSYSLNSKRDEKQCPLDYHFNNLSQSAAYKRISRVNSVSQLSNAGQPVSQKRQTQQKELQKRIQAIKDEKQMLIDKLNVIRPNQLPESKSHLNISKIGYNSRSSYLQARPKTTNMPFGRLQLKTRGETINDMIIRRHENLVGRH